MTNVPGVLPTVRAIININNDPVVGIWQESFVRNRKFAYFTQIATPAGKSDVYLIEHGIELVAEGDWASSRSQTSDPIWFVKDLDGVRAWPIYCLAKG